jgi:hypothetical protein
MGWKQTRRDGLSRISDSVARLIGRLLDRLNFNANRSGIRLRERTIHQKRLTLAFELGWIEQIGRRTDGGPSPQANGANHRVARLVHHFMAPRAFQPRTIGRTEGVGAPPPHTALDSIEPHPKFFWSSYGGRGCTFVEHTLDDGPPIFNGRPFVAWRKPNRPL